MKNWARRTWIEKKSTMEKSQRSSHRCQLPCQWWCQLTGQVTSVDDMAVMTSPGADVSRRRLGTCRRVEKSDGAWSAWAFAQNLFVACDNAWNLRWWLGFHERVDRRRTILVVPMKTQLGQESRRWWYGSDLETLNDDGCRFGTRDDDWNASEV